MCCNAHLSSAKSWTCGRPLCAWYMASPQRGVREGGRRGRGEGGGEGRRGGRGGGRGGRGGEKGEEKGRGGKRGGEGERGRRGQAGDFVLPSSCAPSLTKNSARRMRWPNM